MTQPDFQQQEFEHNLRRYVPKHARLRAVRALRRMLKRRAEIARQEIAPELAALRRNVARIVRYGEDPPRSA